MRAALLVCALAGCGESVVNPCNVDLQIAAAIGGLGGSPCGAFSRGDPNYTDQAMLAAQLCVLNALMYTQSFHLAYDADSTDDPNAAVRAGWVGTVDPMTGMVTLHAYAGRGGGDMASKHDLVSAQTCDMITATPSCTPRVGVPCLTCVTSTKTGPATVACRG
jgi:hypothetical protein